jgi:hypothetical protein
MQIRIGLENNIENRSLAWALDYPGCFAYGSDESEALIYLPMALIDYEHWIRNHSDTPWVELGDLDLRVVEKFETFRMGIDYRPAPPGEGYEINAWFIDDWRPLSSEEIERSLKIFHWQRDELLAGLSTLDPEILNKERPGQRWNILGIAKHIANAELWYLSRLDLVSLNRQDLLPEHEARLMQTSQLIDQTFPSFADRVECEWHRRRILVFQKNHPAHTLAPT